MFELPEMSGVQEVVISRDVVEGSTSPLRIYSDRGDGDERELESSA